MPFFSYGGVLADSPEVRSLLLDKATELARELRARHVELRQGPRCDTGWQETQHKVTMEVSLPDRPGPLWDSLSSGMRNKIRYGPKQGLSARWGGMDELANFYPAFAENMRNLGTPVYPSDWFTNLLRCAPESIKVLTIWDGDKTVAGAFLVGFRDTLEVPWSASLPGSRKKYSHILLYWTFLEWAVQHGYRRMDLGRCTRGGGTYEFKRHFRAEERPLHWYYWLSPGVPLPQLHADNGRYRLATRIWQHLPLAVTNDLGPRIVRGIP